MVFAVPISVYTLSLPLPYLPEGGTTLSPFFMLGCAILVCGLYMYNTTRPARNSTEVDWNRPICVTNAEGKVPVLQLALWPRWNVFSPTASKLYILRIIIIIIIIYFLFFGGESIYFPCFKGFLTCFCFFFVHVLLLIVEAYSPRLLIIYRNL